MKLFKEKNHIIELTGSELDKLKLLVKLTKSVRQLPDEISLFALELEKTLEKDISTREEIYDLGNDFKIKIPNTSREELFNTYKDTLIFKGELFDEKI